MTKELFKIVQAVGPWPGMKIAPDRNGLSLTLGRSRFGHLSWDGRIDLPLEPQVRDRLVAEDLARPDPDEPDADRVVFPIRNGDDVDRAVWLLRLAYLLADFKVEEPLYAHGGL